MGAQGVHYIKGILSWLVRWYCRASTRDFCPALAALVSPRRTLFPLILPHSPASWAGSRAVSPVVMSTIPKRKYKRSDIEANYRNETKTF